MVYKQYMMLCVRDFLIAGNSIVDLEVSRFHSELCDAFVGSNVKGRDSTGTQTQGQRFGSCSPITSQLPVLEHTVVRPV